MPSSVEEATYPESKIQPEDSPMISDSYTSDDADLDLISSNDVIFKVHSHHLRSASTVFSSLLDMTGSIIQRDPIPFTDPIIEHSDVDKEILDIMYTTKFSNTLIVNDPSLVRTIIDSSRKWDMPVITETIAKAMRSDEDDVLEGASHFNPFLLAIHMRYPRLAAKMYVKADGEVWSEPAEDNRMYSEREEGSSRTDWRDEAEHERDRKLADHYLSDTPAAGLSSCYPILHSRGALLFNLGDIPYLSFLSIPPTVVWCMLRAQSTDPRNENRREVGSTLAELLDLAYYYESPSVVLQRQTERLKDHPFLRTPTLFQPDPE